MTLTLERLRDVLSYDPDTGVFMWKNCSRPHLNGRHAGCLRPDGYYEIRIDSESYLAHRLAWFHTYGDWPVNELDHRDLNRGNTKLKNLREATHAQNNHNIGPQKNNRSGIKGVSFHKRDRKWFARIMVNRKCRHLGYFDSADAAGAAYALASAALHRDFARTS